MYGTSGLLVKSSLLFSSLFHLLQCLAVYFLPVLLMPVVVQTHGETDEGADPAEKEPALGR